MAPRPKQPGDTPENETAGAAAVVESSVPSAGGTLPASKAIDLFVGRVLAHYRLEERLDAGGMGVLYRATDLKLGRSVAVKLLARHLSSDQTAKARFVREAQTASALDHPNIGTVYDIGEQDGELFIVMALYEGETLEQRLERGRLSVVEALGILRQVALGLEAAHGAGIVHRDVKPANLFMTRRGTVKILDFGLAKLIRDSQAKSLTDTGQAMGTVLYMSPEQLRGETVDARSDLWSLGVLAYEVLSGVAPFQADSGPATAMRILNDEPLPVTSVPGVPEWLADLIAQLLRKEPGERPQTASEVLRRFDGQTTAPTHRWSVREWFSELKRRRVLRVLVGYGLIGLVVLQIAPPLISALHLADATFTYVVLALALGFPVAVVLAWAFDVSSEGVKRYSRATPGASGLRGAGLALVLIGIGLAAAAPGLGWYFLLHGGARTASPRDGERRAAAEHSSIAVLPFVNMSSEKENEYFSDGITEELINALANIDGLRVASRTSVFAFKGKNLSIKQIGEELNVTSVLEGSIRREGNTVRVVAQLIGATDGYHLWSKTYERELKSVFQLEDELARSIAQALRPKLVTSPPTSLVKPSTANIDAHDLYLRGRFLWQKRTPESLTKAAAYFQQAVELDPTYALAYVGLADASALLIEYGSAQSRDMLPRAKEAVRKALELDSSLAEAHLALGVLGIYEFDWTTAEREVRRAIELKPDDASAHHRYALVLVIEGRCNEALDQAEKASQLDPTSLIISSFVSVSLYCAHDYGRAIEQAKKTLELDPRFALACSYLALSYIGQGRYAEAVQELEKLEATNRYVGDLGYAYGIAGQREKALRLLSDLDARSRREYVTPTVRALIYLGLGEKEQALSWLEKAVAERDWRLRQLKFDPRYDPLRPEPRFARILKEVHLE